MVIVADREIEHQCGLADGDLAFCPRGTKVKIFGVLKYFYRYDYDVPPIIIIF